ncbi:unnamed protein product [Miscanthus lutarioriparius]|uniref:Uncharacterized protein n=1 Tax=Miscanthus lutarioriparius TaxID=422564 RepID=A0A811PF89_9POAL|nr:unnamed protein product [Miscanthus lutarioriparius]
MQDPKDLSPRFTDKMRECIELNSSWLTTLLLIWCSTNMEIVSETVMPSSMVICAMVSRVAALLPPNPKHIWVFWWGAENGKWKIQSKPWEQMILPKSSGALGFKDLRLFNQALLARQIPNMETNWIWLGDKHGVVYKIGDGRSTRIWRDNLIPQGQPETNR